MIHPKIALMSSIFDGASNVQKAGAIQYDDNSDEYVPEPDYSLESCADELFAIFHVAYTR